MLEAKVIPDGLTQSGEDFICLLFTNDKEEQFIQLIPFHREGFDFTLEGSAAGIFILPAHDGDPVPVMKAIAGLLEGEGFIAFSLLKVWRGFSARPLFLHMRKEGLIASVNTFRHILNGL